MAFIVSGTLYRCLPDMPGTDIFTGLWEPFTVTGKNILTVSQLTSSYERGITYVGITAGRRNDRRRFDGSGRRL
jgi:hypothetical protein